MDQEYNDKPIYEEEEDDNEFLSPFHKELEEYLSEYSNHLQTKFSKSTVGKHWSVISEFFFFSIGYKNVKGFEDFTVGIAGSKFAQYYNGHAFDKLSTFTVRNILYGFFSFVYEKYSVANKSFLQKLKPKRVR